MGLTALCLILTGRQTRMTFAENIFGDMRKAPYEKVQFLKALDDTRKTLETLMAFPPGTAIARYLELRLEDIKKAIEETQTQGYYWRIPFDDKTK